MRRGAAALVALALLGAGAEAQEKPVAAEGRISVVGRARAETAPDFAAVEIGVESRGTTPAAALDAASVAVKAILALAGEFKVPEADLSTSAVTLQPVTRSVRQSDGSFSDRADGYRASNTVRVRLADMARLGDLMRRALDGGANRIDGVSFGLRDPEAAESAMRVAAVKDARAQAERLAEAAGVTLGQVLSIQSPPIGNAPPMAFAAPAPMRAKRGGPPVPLVAGTIETSAEVSATFGIAP